MKRKGQYVMLPYDWYNPHPKVWTRNRVREVHTNNSYCMAPYMSFKHYGDLSVPTVDRFQKMYLKYKLGKKE